MLHSGRLSNSGPVERHEQAEHNARPQRTKETAMKYMLLIYGNEADWVEKMPMPTGRNRFAKSSH